MKVSQILLQKGSAEVATISPEASVSEAVRRLSAKRIGALVVSRDRNRVAGILSERDIVRILGADGPTALDAPVSGAMTKKVSSCAPSDTALSVLERMTAGRFRHMPVVEAGQMTGIVSIGDVVKARIGEIEAENAAMTGMLSGF
ncbi:MAG: CBS domain-containing protein [Pseudomonadota bacterium]